MEPILRQNTISKAISLIRFPAVVLIVILHAYTAARGSISDIGSEAYYKISYILSMDLGNMGVPLYFTISGLLFFYHYNKQFSYKRKIQSRFKTLVIPYFCWNLITLAIFFLLQNIEWTKMYFSGNNKLIIDYTFTDFLRVFWDVGNGFPVLSPYWYIRNLFILQLCSPILFYLIKYLKGFYLLVIGIIWAMTPTLTFTYSSIFFFSMGAYISIHHIDLEQQTERFFKFIVTFFILLLAFEFYLHFYLPNPYSIYVQKVLFVCGVICFFTLAIRAAKKQITISNYLGKASFFIYTTHYPIMLGVRKLSLKWMGESTEWGNVLTYFGSAIITIGISLLLYECMRRCMPKVLAFTTGERS